jgi:hypothetical protein
MMPMPATKRSSVAPMPPRRGGGKPAPKKSSRPMTPEEQIPLGTGTYGKF